MYNSYKVDFHMKPICFCTHVTSELKRDIRMVTSKKGMEGSCKGEREELLIKLRGRPRQDPPCLDRRANLIPNTIPGSEQK